jgi:membrane protease YdiL (CAAX protease family)
MMHEPPPRPDLDPTGTLAPTVPGAGPRRGLDGRPLATWRWWEVLGFTLLGFFLGSLAVVPIVLLLGDTTTANGASGASELLQGIIVDLVLLATLFLWLRRRHPTWWQVVGFPTRNRIAKEIGIGAGLGLLVRLVAGIASAGVLIVLEHTTGRSVDLPQQVSSGLSVTGFVLFAFYAVIVAPITEEFVFRGLLYRSIRDRRGVAIGAIVSAIPFGLVHFIPGQPWPNVVALQLTMVVTGIGLALIYERRGTIVADIAGHAAFNLLAVVVLGAGGGFLPGLGFPR